MLRAQSVAKTVAGVFPHALMFQSEPDNDFNDFIFLASSGAIDLNSKLLTPQQTGWLKQRLLAIEPARGVLLTDNLNPLESLQTRKAEHYRHILVDWFGSDLLVP